jgi:phosphonate transport system substrate-binding protein
LKKGDKYKMKKKMFVRVLFGIMCAAIFLGIMAKDSFAWWPWEKKEKAEVLRIGVIPGTEDAEKQIKTLEPVRKYLERELGIEVQMFPGTDYTAIIEAMRAKKLEVAHFGSFSYILAAQRANAEAIATQGESDGSLSTYHSFIITHPGTGLKNMEDVRRRTGELTLVFVDPASTSGHLIPRGHMLSIGIDPDKDFKEVMFAGSHPKSVLAVTARKVDLGANCVWERMIKKGQITPEEVVLIWKSEPIPSGPVAVRGDLDPELKKRIQQAYVNMDEKNPGAMEAMQTTWSKKRVYVPVDDSRYEFYRPLARGLGYIK